MGNKLVRVKLNTSGVKKFLQQDMKPVVEERGAETLSRLGEGYETTSMVGHDRASVFVRAVSDQAMEACLEDNTILKALR